MDQTFSIIKPDATKRNITGRINQIIEEMVIKNPSQWLWSHNRWK